MPAGSSLAQILERSYSLLSDTYRSEYFYKNLIANKIVVGRHRASNVVMLNEFSIGGSVADCVFLNGSSAIYEIKTELDSPEKLHRQLDSYYRAFSNVFVVAHENSAERYLRELLDTPAGLLVVGPRGRLSPIRRARADESRLDVQTMFNALRQGEVEHILTEEFGPLPPVANGLRYAERLSLAQRMDPRSFQRGMQAELKKRSLRADKEFITAPELLPLRALLLQMNPTQAQAANLSRWLQLQEDDGVLPISQGKAV